MQIFVPTMNLRKFVQYVLREDLAGKQAREARGDHQMYVNYVYETTLQQQWQRVDDPAVTEWRDVPTVTEDERYDHVRLK
jgi:hypothetical protein